MRTNILLTGLVFLLVIQGLCYADRQLDNNEIKQILQNLTSKPRETWIPSGTIQATHQAYESATGHTTDSTATVKFDGQKFFWDINIGSYTQNQNSEIPARKHRSKDSFDLKRNRKRTFAWDGDRYTMYFKSGNHAIVTESSSEIPVAVNGPLTAGIVPWGYGIYTYDNLVTKELSATETNVNGFNLITLRIAGIGMIEFTFELDQARDYALQSCIMNIPGQSYISKTYGDYEKIAGAWIPRTIRIERYDCRESSPELISYDYWSMLDIDVQPLSTNSFDVEYENEALIEYKSPGIRKPIFYKHSNEIDTEMLLENKIMIDMASDDQKYNCATKVAKYVAGQFGVSVDDPNLAALVTEENMHTNLYQLRQFVRELGFHSSAVKTNLEALKGLTNCQVILHLPDREHYVILGDVDGSKVWIIDFDSNDFLYSIDRREFAFEWREGTALIISDSSINLPESMTEIDGNRLLELSGASSGIGDYSCSDLIQEEGYVLCGDPVGMICMGEYRWYNERYSCELSATGGSCGGARMVGSVTSVCVLDIDDPTACTDTGERFSTYIRACKQI